MNSERAKLFYRSIYMISCKFHFYKKKKKRSWLPCAILAQTWSNSNKTYKPPKVTYVHHYICQKWSLPKNNLGSFTCFTSTMLTVTCFQVSMFGFMFHLWWPQTSVTKSERVLTIITIDRYEISPRLCYVGRDIVLISCLQARQPNDTHICTHAHVTPWLQRITTFIENKRSFETG